MGQGSGHFGPRPVRGQGMEVRVNRLGMGVRRACMPSGRWACALQTKPYPGMQEPGISSALGVACQGTGTWIACRIGDGEPARHPLA